MCWDALNIEKGQHPDALQFGLIGLHPCGDLAPSLLRLFLACRECRFIKLVCCCYMKLSCESSISNGEPKEYGFPLSDFCRRTNLTLSYEAREMACHAIEQYRERLSGDYHELKIHAYRAAIESIIVRLRPDLKHAGLKGGIRATEVSFAEYCQRAVDGLGVTVPESDVHSAATQSRLSRWEEVVKFYTIRLMFAPLIETIVLYDRWLFLLEQGNDQIKPFLGNNLLICPSSSLQAPTRVSMFCSIRTFHHGTMSSPPINDHTHTSARSAALADTDGPVRPFCYIF